MLQEAKDPTTPPARLTYLAKHGAVRVQKAVTQNPGTPPWALFRLGALYPEEFLENPVLSLLLLENPDVWRTMPAEVVLALCERELLTDEMLRSLVRHSSGEVRHWLARHSSDDALLEELLRDNNYHTLGGLLENLSLPEGLLWRMAKSEDATLRQMVAASPRANEEVLHFLSKDESVSIRATVAAHSKASPGTLLRLARGRSEGRLHHPPNRAAANANLSAGHLARLALHRSALVRGGVADNPSTTKATLRVLAQDKDPRVRARIARRNDSALTGRLVHDPVLAVRETLAMFSISPRFLRILARDKRVIRLRVAENPSTPSDALQGLADDPSDEIRGAVARHPNTKKTTLRWLANDARLSVRCGVAVNPNAPAETLTAMAQEPELRPLLIENAGAPITLLMRLAKDSSEELREEIAVQKRTPEKVLRVLFTNATEGVRGALACNPSTPEDILHVLSRDSDAEIRKNVVQNPRTARATLYSLLWDTEPLVVREAIKALREKKLAGE